MQNYLQQEAIKANLNYDSEEHPYVQPVKKIRDEATLKQFHASAQGIDLIMFIVETQKAVKGIKMTDIALPDHIKPLYDYIEKLNTLLDEVPPIQ